MAMWLGIICCCEQIKQRPKSGFLSCASIQYGNCVCVCGSESSPTAFEYEYTLVHSRKTPETTAVLRGGFTARLNALAAKPIHIVSTTLSKRWQCRWLIVTQMIPNVFAFLSSGYSFRRYGTMCIDFAEKFGSAMRRMRREYLDIFAIRQGPAELRLFCEY